MDVVDRAASACISCMGVVAAGIQVTIGAFAAGEWSPTFIAASLLVSEHPLLQLCVVRSLHSVAGIHRSAALDLCIIGVFTLFILMLGFKIILIGFCISSIYFLPYIRVGI